MSEEQQVRRGI